jgi:hypothetical protein
LGLSLALYLIGTTLGLIGLFLSLIRTVFRLVGIPLFLIGSLLGLAFLLTLPIVRTSRLFLFLFLLLSSSILLEIEISRFYSRDWFNTLRGNSRK